MSAQVIHKPKWGISSFEISADQLAEHVIRNTRMSIHWVGLPQRCYSALLGDQVSIAEEISKGHGAIGLFGFLGRFLRLKKLCQLLGDGLLSHDIEGIVVVDFPSFHIPLVTYLKKKRSNLRVIYVAPPKTWASRSSRLGWIRKYVDQLVTIYAYEYRYFKERGLPCVLLQSPWENVPVPFSHGLSDRIILYPGSRLSEIRNHLAICIQAARQLISQGMVKEVYMSISSHLWKQISKTVPRDKGFHYFCDEWVPIRGSFVAWVCSGTMTAKVATWGLPMIILYKLDRLSYGLLRFLWGYRSYFGIPNIIFGQECYPEIIGPSLTSEQLIQTHLKIRAEKKMDHYGHLSQKIREVQSQGMPWSALREVIL